MKRVQNRIAESRIALPIVAIYALVIWLAGGLIGHQWWLQFTCFALSTYLMLELNNTNALIRIFSRMVSCSFLVLTTAACFLFGSATGSIASLCLIAAIFLLSRTYQDYKAMGLSLYAFLCISIASIHEPAVLLFVPVFWILMAINLQSLNIRTWGASIVGVLLPYWAVAIWKFYSQDMGWFGTHFSSIVDFSQLGAFTVIPSYYWLYIAVLIGIALMGIVHYLNNSYQDKIRIRLIFESFITLDIVSFAYLIIQPQHYDIMLRMMIINTSPLIGHYIALTHTKITNITFHLLVGGMLVITAYYLWTYSFNF